MKPALEALFGDQAAAFVPGSLPDRHIHVQASVDRLSDVMRSGDASSFERLSRVYAGTLQMAGGVGEEARQVRVEGPRPAQIVAMGLTAYFFDLLPSVPALFPWRAQLARDLEFPARTIRCAAWASPHGGGLMPHFDRYDGIIIQLAGEKLYRIGPNEYFNHTARQWSPRQSFDVLDVLQFEGRAPPDKYPADLQEVLLTPGSVLFLPRGYWHATKASGESFSLSIRMDPPIFADVVLAQLRFALLKDEEWRRPAYGAWGDAEGIAAARSRLEERLAALPTALRRLSADSAFANTAEVADQFKHVTSTTTLCRVWTKAITFAPLPRATAADDGEALLVVSIRDAVSFLTDTFKISAATEPVLSWLASAKGVFTLGDLERRFPDFEAADLHALLRAFAHKEAIAVIPFAVGET